MDIGLFSGAAGRVLTPAEVVADTEDAKSRGITSYWIPQMPHGTDPIVALAIAGQAVDTIEFGTAVLNVYSRHPLATAQQAATLSTSLGAGRLSLGLVLSHKP